MVKKTAILTSGHPPFDERIYWKFGRSLSEAGSSVRIICSTDEININEDKITIKGFEGSRIGKSAKYKKFLSFLTEFSPDLIICCEAFTVLPSYRYKKKINKSCTIIYDITEWYPENTAFKLKGIKKVLAYLILFKLNVFVSNLSDGLIIGEIGKKKRYDFIAPFKPKSVIGYYPVLEFFDYNPPHFDGKNLTLCYAGLISFERGILSLLEIGDKISGRHPGLSVRIKIAGKFQSEYEEKIFDEQVLKFNKIIVEKAGWTQYPKIYETLSDADICFDLRESNFIYDNSLPIKIFEYMAAGKPFIFSYVKAIENELGKLDCGYLVDPKNTDDIVDKIESYLSDKHLLSEHSKNGRSLIENGRNWETESKKLIEFLKRLTGNEHSL